MPVEAITDSASPLNEQEATQMMRMLKCRGMYATTVPGLQEWICRRVECHSS